MKPLFAFAAAALLSAAFILISPDPSSGTQILHRSAPELGQQSELVVRGKVVGVRSYWNENQTKIFTETTIAADESYKGRAGAVVRLTQLGGTVDNTKVTVSGALQWKEGEEVLVFLERYTADTYHVSGFSQGKFTIERDPATGKAFVNQAPSAGAEVITKPGSQPAMTSGRSGKITLDELLNQALGQR